jgi:4'-phosphopantetheinyl transferase EntD
MNIKNMQDELQAEVQKRLSIFFNGRPTAARTKIIPNKHIGLDSTPLKQEVKEQLLALVAPSESVKMSVSHTNAGSLGLIVVVGSDQFIGVDVEALNRSVHPAVGPRISHGHETHFGLTPLEKWVIKEAAFKANPKNQDTYLPQYKIVQWDNVNQTGILEPPQLPPHWKCFFTLLKLQNWYFAFARCANGTSIHV